MKLLRVAIIKAETCGGLLDDFDLRLRNEDAAYDKFDPLCFVGPNGSGKSQFMQLIAEIFQTICHYVVPPEERLESNPSLLFEVEYLIRRPNEQRATHVRASRRPGKGRKRSPLVIEQFSGAEWTVCDLEDPATVALLPAKVVGYTSGDNETLSLPFLVSRRGYADEVSSNALKLELRSRPIPDTRLMLIDYGTNLEILVANLLLSELPTRSQLLAESNVNDIDSFRCVIQLRATGPRSAPEEIRRLTGRSGVQLTTELEEYLERLIDCATCHLIEKDKERYTLDFYVDDESRKAFRAFCDTPLALYGALHKLAMLNDLSISKTTRDRFKKETRERRFASRLPEPQDEDKVFRFDQVKLRSSRDGSPVDYVALSDGEHQMTQILGTLAMQASPGVLFLLDEPESHFNPQWRVRFLKRIMDLPTVHGLRGVGTVATRVDEQECILTTHAPFVPSDMPRERIFVFKRAEDRHRVEVSNPAVQTYGATFDTIVEECFGVQPPISKKSLAELEELLSSQDADEVERSLARFGTSVEKAFLVNHLKQLKERRGR